MEQHLLLKPESSLQKTENNHLSKSKANRRSGLAGAVLHIINCWALFGGFLLLSVVAMNVVSVVGGVVWKPFPGDFELTQVAVANAAFAFLPYCQINNKNVTADIFTAGASPQTVLFFRLFASLIAVLFATLLCWRMYEGMLNQYQYDYTTAIVQFPIWLAFLPVLGSLLLLAIAALISFGDELRTIMKA